MVSLLCQATNKIQHEQELVVVYKFVYKVYKGKTCHPLNVRLEEHWKVVVWGEIEKSGIADHI